MNIDPREPVILAGDFDKLVAWYCDALGFRITRLLDTDYHYCNLASSAGMKLAIASAAEMKITQSDRSQNTVVLQVQVEDVSEFLESINQHGGTITAGPSFDKKDEFWFGSFADPEGNTFWVVDSNCP